ncbi:MAG: hypothetical protein P1U56_04645 [Saprospiraceae bacterium]|nr:hypothetical protein [Saprospiraceae bacterium]
MHTTSFKQFLEENYSKEGALKVVQIIQKNPARMEELMECFFDKDLRTCQRAAWPAGMIADYEPQLIIPYLEKMLLNLEAPQHDAVVRNTFRTLQNMDIPEEVEGLAFEKAFEFLFNPQNAIAIRVFAMSVCGNIALKYPELKHELIPVIEEQIPYGSAGFKNRGAKVLKLLNGV